jgi:hypothetical protein
MAAIPLGILANEIPGAISPGNYRRYFNKNN